MWLKVDGFVEKVHAWQDSYNFQGSPGYRIVKKLNFEGCFEKME